MFPALWQSLYSAPLYRDVQRWRGRTLVYLAWVLALCWIPVAIRFQVNFVRILQSADKEVVPQIPDIGFAKGKIMTPENRPYFLRFGTDKEKVHMIIDTSGKYTSLDGVDAQVLVTRDKCFVRQKSGEMRMYDLSKSKSRPVVINQEVVRRLMGIARRWAAIVVFSFVFVFSYIKRLVQGFLIALFGLALASVLEIDLDLGELLSLAVVAMTPAMVLQTLWVFTGLNFRFAWLLWGLLILGYFLFAMSASATRQPPPAEE